MFLFEVEVTVGFIGTVDGGASQRFDAFEASLVVSLLLLALSRCVVSETSKFYLTTTVILGP